MIKGIMFFVIIWVLVAVGIKVVRHMTLMEKLNAAKLVIYSGITAVVAFGILSLVVILF